MNLKLIGVPDELRRRLIFERKLGLFINPLCALILGWIVWRYYGLVWGLVALGTCLAAAIAAQQFGERRRIRIYHELGLVRVDPIHLGVNLGKALLLAIPAALVLGGVMFLVRSVFEIDPRPLMPGFIGGICGVAILAFFGRRRLREIRVTDLSLGDEVGRPRA